MTRFEKIFALIIASMFVSLAVMLSIFIDKRETIEKLEHEKIELKSTINLQNVEIESLKLSLNEAHEVNDMLFMEGMDLTERYNELKTMLKKEKEMILPSKELISEVLSKEVEEERFIDSNSLTYVNSGIYEDINIYEFAFKCKEWAWENYKILLISQYTGQCYINGDLSDLKLPYWENTKSFQVESSTEIECIIKACEWILKERK